MLSGQNIQKEYYKSKNGYKNRPLFHKSNSGYRERPTEQCS